MSWRDLVPGQRPTSKRRNELADMAEERIAGAGGLSVARRPGGLAVTPPPRRTLSARTTGAPTGSAYPWAEIYYDLASSGWLDLADGRTGSATALPARERSGNTGVPSGTRVELELDPSGEFFLFDAPGGTPGTITTDVTYSGDTITYTNTTQNITGVSVINIGAGTTINSTTCTYNWVDVDWNVDISCVINWSSPTFNILTSVTVVVAVGQQFILGARCLWNGVVISPTYGGTGVNNGSYTCTLGGNITTAGPLVTSGANSLTLTTTGTTNVTLPTTGTLATVASVLTITPLYHPRMNAGGTALENSILQEVSGAAAFAGPVRTSGYYDFSAQITVPTTTYWSGYASSVDGRLTFAKGGVDYIEFDSASGGRIILAGATANVSLEGAGAFFQCRGLDGATGTTAYGDAVTGGIITGTLASASTARTALGLGTAAVLASDTDGTLAANSDLRIATQKAVKTYVDASVTGLLDFKGSTDCSANPNYPAASKGDAYFVSVAGKIGGASGKSVDVGDLYVASADNAGGTEAAVGTSWFVLEHNLVGAAVTSGTLAQFAATTSAQLAGVISDETGTDKLVFNTSPTLVTPLLGTPTSGVLTNCTGLPISTGVTGLAANVATFLATPSSANLAAAVTDETGSGALVFGTSPTLSNPVVGTQSPGDNSTKAASTAFVQAAASANALALNPAAVAFFGAL